MDMKMERKNSQTSNNKQVMFGKNEKKWKSNGKAIIVV